MNESNESQNILDLPDDDISYLSPEEAQQHINQVMRAARDPSHPYSDAHSPDHKRVVEKVQRLYQVASPDDPQTDRDGQVLIQHQQFPREVVEAMEVALEIQEKKKAGRIARAQAEMDVLVDEYGYERTEIPDGIQDYQINLLRAQRLNMSPPTPDTLQELNAILEKEARGVAFDSELTAAISHLTQARLTLGSSEPEAFQQIADNVIFLINKAHDKKQEAQKAGKG
ncbi:MAG: hypothetical protein ABIF19_15175 [Planctomycetota bacterium]